MFCMNFSPYMLAYFSPHIHLKGVKVVKWKVLRLSYFLDLGTG